jgi:hypothetical protein
MACAVLNTWYSDTIGAAASMPPPVADSRHVLLEEGEL